MIPDASVEIRVFQSAADTAQATARRVADALRSSPDLVLGLPTGRTPIATYAELRRLCAAGEVDFSRATIFNLDEFVGIDGAHPGSFRRFMQHHLFSGVNVDASRVHALDGAAPDPDAECDRYEAAIDAAGRLALQLLGIGTNGHIGFNEPADRLVARTHRVTLHDSTRQANAVLFGGDPAQVPREGLTMGMGTILKARTIVLIATGERKAASVARAVQGPLTTQVPASFLQTHGHVELYLDTAAAALLDRSRPT